MTRIFIAILILSSATLRAENDSVRSYNLGEVIVTDKKREYFRTITIEKTQNKSFMDNNSFNAAGAIKNLTGIYVRKNSRNESMINIRGFGQRQVPVLIDGAPVYAPWEGFVDAGQIMLTGISAIKISKSMPSLLYGANAMGGSINIISGGSEKVNTSIMMQGWENFQEYMIRNSGSYGKFFWSAGVAFLNRDYTPMAGSSVFPNESGGRRINSKATRNNLVAKAGWKFTAGSEMAISFSHFNNSYSVPPNVLSEYPRWWNYPEWKKSLVNLLHKFTINQYLTINGNVYYEKYDNILNSYDDKEMFSQEKKYAFSSVYDDYGLGANLIATLNYDWLPETRVGLRLKHDIHGQKTDINEPAEEFEARTISAAAEQETTAFNDRLALYWGAGLDWLAPVYANGGELRDAANALNIQGGAGYDIRENIRISAHIARRNRFPTLKELYAELLGGFVPNPDLSSENTINYELAGTYEYESLLVVGALFFNDINNLIAVDYLPENVRSFRNIGSADYRGFELSADFDYKGISLSSNYTYIFSENTSESAQSSIIEHIPRHNLNLIAAAESGFGLAIRGEFEFRGHIYSYNTNKRRQQQIDDYGVINLRAEQRIYDELYLFFRVNNIADRYYVTEWGFPSPGRQIIAGTSYNL